MGKKSGKAGNPVPPAAPKEPEDADIADPGKVAEGTLEEKGIARIEGFEKGTCKVSFPELDKEAWEKI